MWKKIMRKILVSILLVLASIVLGLLGRAVLDWAAGTYPAQAHGIYRWGGSCVGLLIGVFVGIPLLRLHGIFEKKAK